LFSLGDTSSQHIKAEIDERDVDKVSIGQKVVIQADALDGKRLNGSVVRISEMMGRKSISTGDPSDRYPGGRDWLRGQLSIIANRS
jgi:multidrug resistance efflux pump